MYAGIVNAWKCMYSLEEINILLTAVLSLRACGDKMVRVETLDEA